MSMNALAHLDNSMNLPTLVDKLPGYLRSRWRSLALKLFILDAALEANDPLYRIKAR